MGNKTIHFMQLKPDSREKLIKNETKWFSQKVNKNNIA